MNQLSEQEKAVTLTRNFVLRCAYYVFFVVGTLALGYVCFVFADSRNYETLEMKKFDKATPRLEPHTLIQGEVIGEIQVPRLNLSAMVVQGDSHGNLRRAVGHIPKSALPGEAGNVALAGHRDTFFRPLGDIRVGDEIRFKTLERTFAYRVESIEVVSPTETRVLDASTDHNLTLLTCFPFYYIGPAPKRFVVHAREVGGPG